MTAPYRITLARVENYKRIREVEIRPAADRAVLYVSGKNAQGKSSLFDALEAAIGGKRAIAGDPVRHGAEEAKIVVELNGGELTVTRRITKDGGGSLELRDPDRKIGSPQGMLDAIIGSRFLDPIGFVREQPARQREFLLGLVDSGGKIPKLDAQHARIFEARTDVGRRAKAARGELDRLKELPVIATIDVAKLAAERAGLAEKQQEGAKAMADLKIKEQRISDVDRGLEENAQRIRQLEQDLQRARDDRAAMESNRDHAAEAHRKASALAKSLHSEWEALAPRRAEIDSEFAKADQHNRAAYEAKANNDRREAAKKNADDLAQQYEAQTKKLAEIDAARAEVLASAKLPVDGLGFDAAGITLNGVPFDQASAAERIRVAIGLAISSSPKLDDIWIRDASLLDDDSLARVEAQAGAAGKRVWLEVVSNDAEGAIIISDGQVANG